MENCSSLKCFYNILGVDKDSSAAEIRTAYRKLAMRWHPDKCSHAKGDAEEQAKLKFQVVQEAYSVLSDETKRLMYDNGLHDDDDPSLRDFMQDLLNKMKEASAASSKGQQSSADLEFQELSKLYTAVADPDNYVRDCKQFDSDAEQQPNTVDSPPKPHPNLFNPKGCSEYSFWGDCANASREFGYEFETPTTSSPQPHPNLHGEPDFVDRSADHRLDKEFLDFISAQASALKEPQFSRVVPAQGFINPATQNNFASVFNTHTREYSTTPGGSAASSNLSSEAFCMGVGGDGSAGDSRGQGKGPKSRRKKR